MNLEDLLQPKEESKLEEDTKLNNEQTKERPPSDSEWGYDLYPERRRQKVSAFRNLMQGRGRENIDKFKCERKVYNCVQRSPLIKLMMGALKSSGCAIDIRRHIACEECSPTVSGGYDPQMNQIVVCQNVATSKGLIQGVLTHEMIHMFDYCRHKLDFKNIDHLACTEIRAANLTHCSFISAWLQGDTSIFNVKESHQICVKNKALQSILAVRNVTTVQAVDAIEKVFSQCYSDLEPIGRRIRRGSEDMYKAYAEGPYYGYEL